MAYREQYVLAVVVNGKIQKETNDVVVLPFGAEYQLRLKNKSRKRAVADVHIDGRVAAKGVVIQADGTLDLERFVDGSSLSNGPRFKLAKTSDPKVSQPDDVENGLIHVNFYPEKDPVVTERHVIHEEHKHYCTHHINCHCNHIKCFHGHCCGSCPNCHGLWNGPFYGSSVDSNSFSTKGLSAGGGGTVSAMAMNCGTQMGSAPAFSDDSEAAATVEGSLSSQSFSTTFVDVDLSKCVTLTIKLRGVNQLVDQCGCGFKRKDESYCPRCGKQLAVAA